MDGNSTCIDAAAISVIKIKTQMSPKKNAQTAQAGSQGEFAAQVEASRRAHEWAVKCLAYRDAGKPALAKNAERKARHWLRRAMTLEARASGRPSLANRI